MKKGIYQKKKKKNCIACYQYSQIFRRFHVAKHDFLKRNEIIQGDVLQCCFIFKTFSIQNKRVDFLSDSKVSLDMDRRHFLSLTSDLENPCVHFWFVCVRVRLQTT